MEIVLEIFEGDHIKAGEHLLLLEQCDQLAVPVGHHLTQERLLFTHIGQ